MAKDRVEILYTSSTCEIFALELQTVPHGHFEFWEISDISETVALALTKI